MCRLWREKKKKNCCRTREKKNLLFPIDFICGLLKTERVSFLCGSWNQLTSSLYFIKAKPEAEPLLQQQREELGIKPPGCTAIIGN